MALASSLQVYPILYVLELQDGKWYVGTSLTLNIRLAQHLSGAEDSGASRWVKKHKFVSVKEVRYPALGKMEDTVTLEYMRRFGWQNVRGGSWSQVEIPEKPRALDELEKFDKYYSSHA